MDTQTLDKLYLEWSQFTKARTSGEIIMEAALKRVVAFDPGRPPSDADTPEDIRNRKYADIARRALAAAESKL
jgi:hypothetical protein